MQFPKMQRGPQKKIKIFKVAPVAERTKNSSRKGKSMYKD